MHPQLALPSVVCTVAFSYDIAFPLVVFLAVVVVPVVCLMSACHLHGRCLGWVLTSRALNSWARGLTSTIHGSTSAYRAVVPAVCTAADCRKPTRCVAAG